MIRLCCFITSLLSFLETLRNVLYFKAYMHAGAQIQEDISDASVIFGVKQVPIDALIPGKTYCFFSHTIKAQESNMPLLDAILEKVRSSKKKVATIFIFLYIPYRKSVLSTMNASLMNVALVWLLSVNTLVLPVWSTFFTASDCVYWPWVITHPSCTSVLPTTIAIHLWLVKRSETVATRSHWE